MQDEVMSKDDIIKRRYEAMRMRWPDKFMTFIQQEMLVILRMRCSGYAG